ncbi:unnamed protein product [Lymnaea stagnalis]|uniref:Uncharacterized protein n=1 Tax=Lymnaea stagnalis TaxID=6523 RepID=A0AAV2I5K3_LYMST
MTKLFIWVLLVGVAIVLSHARRSSEEDERRNNQRDNARRDDKSRSKSRAADELARKIKGDMEKRRRDRDRQLQDVRRAIRESIADRIGDSIANRLARIVIKSGAPGDDSQEVDSREGSTSLETTINSDIQDLVREIKSKVLDKLISQKDFVSSSFRDRLDKLTKALRHVKLFEDEVKEKRNEDESADVDVSTENTPTSLPDDLEKAIEEAIQYEIERSEETAVSDNTPIGSLLVRQLVSGFEAKVDDLRSAWKDFVKAKQDMVEKAKVLNQHPRDGKGFDFEKLRVYKASLQEMLAKKRNFVESKVELKRGIEGTLNNMSRTYRSRTGRDFSYADFLESVLNASFQFPRALEEFFKDVICRSVTSPRNDNQEAEISASDAPPEIAGSDAPPAPTSTATTSAGERLAEDIIVDIIDTVKGIKENVEDKVSALRELIQSTIQPKLDQLKETIEKFLLDEDEVREENRRKRSIEDSPGSAEEIVTEASQKSDEIPAEILTSIERAVNSLVSGSVAFAPTANEAILDGLILELLKPFDADIQTLKELKQKYNEAQAQLLSDVASLRTDSDELKNVSDIYTRLSQLPTKFNQLKLVRSQYQAEKTKLITEATETLKSLSASYQDRTGSPVSYIDVLISLKNSSIDLPPVLQDYYTDLSSVARVEGLRMDVAPRGEGGEGSDDSSVVVVSVVGVLAAVVVTMGVSALVLRHRRRQRLYTKLPN